MDMIFWYFLKSSVDDVVKTSPICSQVYLGEIGDFVELDGVGFIIVDYAIEQHSWEELIEDHMDWI